MLLRLAVSAPPVASSPAKRPTPVTSRPAAPPTPAPARPDLAAVLATGERGDYSAAARLAAALPEDQRAPAFSSLFSTWAVRERSAAATAALALSDPPLRDLAWCAVIRPWAATDPGSLATFARDLPAGAARNAALDEALRHWLDHDLSAALAWVETLPSSLENDLVVARVAEYPGLIGPQPDLAIAWAESVRDPALRSHTLGKVVREWRGADPDAAERYARNSPELTASEREDILVGERFTPHP